MTLYRRPRTEPQPRRGTAGSRAGDDRFPRGSNAEGGGVSQCPLRPASAIATGRRRSDGPYPSSSPTHHPERLPPLHPFPDAFELGHVLVIRHGEPPVVLLQRTPDAVHVIPGPQSVLRVGAGVGDALARYLASGSLQRAWRREPMACPCADDASDS